MHESPENENSCREFEDEFKMMKPFKDAFSAISYRFSNKNIRMKAFQNNELVGLVSTVRSRLF